MKIRIIKETPKGSGNKTWQPGTELNVSNRYAERLVKAGNAKYIDDTSAEVWEAMLAKKLAEAKSESNPKRKSRTTKKQDTPTVEPAADEQE